MSTRDEKVAAWKKLQAHDPDLASELDPFMREFGCTELVYWSHEKTPPHVRGFAPYHARLERLVTAFPDVAQSILDGLRSEVVCEAEAKIWWG